MDQRRRKRCEARLSWRVPLLGGWFRRRAAEALARDATPESTLVLAVAVSRSVDPRVFAIAMEHLNALSDPLQIDAACAVWAGSRHPALGRLQLEHGWVATQPVRVRVLSSLHADRREAVTNGSADVVGPLVDACDDLDPDVALRARECLLGLEQPSAVDEVCAQWISTRSEVLGEAVERARYVAHNPIEVRVLSALKTRQPDSLEKLGRRVIEPLLLACADADAVVNAQARIALKQLKNRDAIDDVCRIVVEDNHPVALEFALAAGYLPRDNHQRALFLFLTEQWERYEALDFDGRLLRASYEAAGPPLRLRLREKLRSAGRTDFLNVVGGSDFRARAAVMTPDEAEFLVQMLASHQEWAKLWTLIFELAFGWGVKIVRILAASEWKPAQPDERATFEELAQLASHAIPDWDEALSHALPPALMRAHVRVSGEVNDVAFSPRHPTIALALRRRKVVVWNFQRGEREERLSGFDHSIGRVTYTDGASLLCAERTTKPSEDCSVYLCPKGEKGRRKVGTHRGAVTAIESAGNGRLLSAGRDGKVILWDLATSRKLHEAKVPAGAKGPDSWARATRLSSDGKFAVLLYDGLSLVRLPEIEFLSSVGWQGTTRCAAFSPDDRALIVGQYNGEVRVIARNDTTLDHRYRAFCRHSGQVQGIEVLPERSVVVTAGSGGDVLFTSWSNWAPVGRLAIAGDRLTSLRISADGSFMAVGDSDASMSLWDLRVLDVPLLLARPLAKAVPVHLAAVRALGGDQNLPARARDSLRFVECVLRHRFRYDIEIDEMPAIRLGEFDIEVA